MFSFFITSPPHQPCRPLLSDRQTHTHNLFSFHLSNERSRKYCDNNILHWKWFKIKTFHSIYGSAVWCVVWEDSTIRIFSNCHSESVNEIGNCEFQLVVARWRFILSLQRHFLLHVRVYTLFDVHFCSCLPNLCVNVNEAPMDQQTTATWSNITFCECV